MLTYEDFILKERLKIARKETGKTQKEIATIIGVTESAYCGYETGKRSPDAVKIAMLASALGVSGDYLLGLENEPHPKNITAETDEEKALLHLYRQIDSKKQDALLEMLQK